MNSPNLQDFDIHPVAALFPLMSRAELKRLGEDIDVNGQHDPCWFIHSPKGRSILVDGRNRIEACRLKGFAPDAAWLEGPNGVSNVVSWILSRNLHRRHLTKPQRAMLAAKLANLEHGTNQFKVQKETAPAVSFVPEPENVSMVEVETPPVTQAQAAEMFQVSVDSVQRAQKIAEADPEIAEKVTGGELSLAEALARVTEKPSKVDPDAARKLARKAVVRAIETLESQWAHLNVEDHSEFVPRLYALYA